MTEKELNQLQEIKNNLIIIDDYCYNALPPIIFYYQDDNNITHKEVLTPKKEYKKEQEIFIVCSRELYEELPSERIKDNFYLCNTMEEVKEMALYIAHHYEIFSTTSTSEDNTLDQEEFIYIA